MLAPAVHGYQPGSTDLVHAAHKLADRSRGGRGRARHRGARSFSTSCAAEGRQALPNLDILLLQPLHHPTY